MLKRLAVVQSNYIPWRGYFDIIGLVDEFVTYDIVQFTKRDWRNRNRIKTKDGVQWLTIPVVTAGRFNQTVAETRIAGRGWATKHWQSLSRAYARARYFEMYRDRFADAYRACGALEYLSEVNRTFIDLVVSELGLSTKISDAADYVLDGDRNNRLIALCRQTGANVYLSGPSARGYLDIGLFNESGIEVEFMDYSDYQPYPQLHEAFEPAVTVLDLLFNVGHDAISYMRCRDRGTGNR